MVAVTTKRVVAALAGPGIRAAREVYLSVPSDALRVAALVEISAAAAALARTIVKLRRLDPELVAPHVTDCTDLRAVLGQGRWLPTMVRHVPASPSPVGAKGQRRLCAHADEDGRGMHWLAPGERCSRAARPEPSQPDWRTEKEPLPATHSGLVVPAVTSREEVA